MVNAKELMLIENDALSLQGYKEIFSDENCPVKYDVSIVDDNAKKKLKDLCINYPFYILDNESKRFVLQSNEYFELIIEKIISRIPKNKNPIRSKAARVINSNVLSWDELEKIRTCLMKEVSFRQSPKIDDLCMKVIMTDILHSEDILQNWLDLMLKNCSGNLLRNFADIIDAINNEKNLPREIRAKMNISKKKTLLREAGYKDKKWLSFLKELPTNFDTIKSKVNEKLWDEVFGNKKIQGKYIGIVAGKFPKLYEEIRKSNSPIEILTTLSSVQTIFKNIDEYKKWVPALEDKKESLVYVIAETIGNSNVNSETYSKFVDLLISGLKETSSVNAVLDKLFQYQDKYTVVDKAKVVLTKSDDTKFTNELKRGVAYRFIDLLGCEDISASEKDSIKSILIDFIQNCNIDVVDNQESLRNDIIEKYCEAQNQHRIDFVKAYMSLSNQKYKHPRVCEIVLKESDFDDNDKKLTVDILIDKYKEYKEQERSLIDSILLDVACGKIKVPDYLRENIVEGMTQKNELFISNLKSKLDEEKLWGKLPDCIMKKIISDKNIISTDKSHILISRLSSMNEMELSKKESLKTDILDYVLSGKENEAEVRTFLSKLLNEFVVK